ncbi:MAG: helix-turn-helix transcriptional regulator [Lachnospiraceae bacterium]|nr:helix-turn-helix transcriptional regulator [Lachnospiraceae bacterium]MBP3610874.1 helix-turn-helix transcriptional regulator [Lachnospiraceae bacterium]
MNYIRFHADQEFTYHWCGKFVSPDDNWTHLTRDLMDYELFVVTEGLLFIAANQREFTVAPGEYLLMPPTPFQHGIKKSHCVFYWMHFGYHNEKNDHELLTAPSCLPSARDSSTTSLTYTPGRILLPEQGRLTSPDRIIILMKQLQDSDRRYREITLNRYLCSAVLSEVALQGQIYPAYGNQIIKEQLYQDICDYVFWHLTENLKVSQVANYFGYNEKYLTTFFKQRAGISLKQYILQIKMERAKADLSETTEPVSQIAFRLGFSDSHNFSNAFRKITGLSPSEYRDSYNRHNVFPV